jgi:hypothetical protein
MAAAGGVDVSFRNGAGAGERGPHDIRLGGHATGKVAALARQSASSTLGAGRRFFAGAEVLTTGVHQALQTAWHPEGAGESAWPQMNMGMQPVAAE